MGGSRGLHPTFRGVRAKGGPQPGTTTTQGSPSFSWGEPRALVLSRGLGGTWGSPPRAQHVLKVWSLCCWVTSASPCSGIWGGLLTLYTLPRSPAPSLAASSPRAGEERAALGGGAGGAPQRGAALAAEPLLPTASPPASRRAPPGLNPPPPQQLQDEAPTPHPREEPGAAPPPSPPRRRQHSTLQPQPGPPPQGRGEAGDRRRPGLSRAAAGLAVPGSSPQSCREKSSGSWVPSAVLQQPPGHGELGAKRGVARTPPSPCPPPLVAKTSQA